jgi:hypothetical protein
MACPVDAVGGLAKRVKTVVQHRSTKTVKPFCGRGNLVVENKLWGGRWACSHATTLGADFDEMPARQELK